MDETRKGNAATLKQVLQNAIVAEAERVLVGLQRSSICTRLPDTEPPVYILIGARPALARYACDPHAAAREHADTLRCKGIAQLEERVAELRAFTGAAAMFIAMPPAPSIRFLVTADAITLANF